MDMHRLLRDFRIRNSQLLVAGIYLALLVFGCKFPVELERIGYLALVMIAAYTAETRTRAAKHAALVLAVIFFVLASLFVKDVVYDVVLMLLCIAILVHSAWSVISFLSRAESISDNEILGLVNCYIIIGFIWAFVYCLVEVFFPGSFSFTQPRELLVDVFIYYSFSTITTVGYGDIIPASDFAQRISIVEAIVGQFYFALVVAYLLSKYASRRSGRKAPSGGQEAGTGKNPGEPS